MSRNLRAGLMFAAAFQLAALPAFAQPEGRPPVSGYAKPTLYPNANQAAVSEHFNRARRIAGDDLYTFFDSSASRTSFTSSAPTVRSMRA